MSKKIESSREDGFWSLIRKLRERELIPKHWNRADIRPHLIDAGYARNSVNTIPSNQSISGDGTIKGDYVKKGLKPMAYRLGSGRFELIDDPANHVKENPVIRDNQSTCHANARERLVALIRKVVPAKIEQLDAMKRTDFWEAPEFIWEALLLSLSTMGNSRGAALVRNKMHHQYVQFSGLAALSSAGRRKRLEDTLRAAKVRMPSKKAIWLDQNFTRIKECGGPDAVKKELEACSGPGEKIRFLKTFKGIGDKYARNLMMDAYHADFRNTIAIDVRVKKVSEVLGIKFRSYLDAERFFLDVARDAGINGWELDRLIYNFTDELIGGLKAQRQ